MAALASAAVVMFAVEGCSEDKKNPQVPLLFPPCPAITAPAGATVLRSGSVLLDRRIQCYYLLKLDYDGNDSSYAMWIPPKDEGARPAVVMTRPYDYIRWSGDMFPSSVNVMPNAQYVRDAGLFLINGFGVLNVFERFYAGGDIQNDVDDTVAGLRFLRDSGFVDTARIGIWGGSWGGFEALYGAANAPAGAIPAAGVAFFPLSDFSDLVDYVENPAGGIPNSIPDVTDVAKRSQYETFFKPYLERIKAVTGWNTWDDTALLLKLNTPFMVVHDEWDTLVPFEETEALAADPDITPLYFYQDTRRDLNSLISGWGHGEIREYNLDNNPPPVNGLLFGISNTLASAYLFTRIIAADKTAIIIGYDVNALNDFIGYLRDYKCVHGRETMAWAAKLLRDCTDSRMIMAEMHGITPALGADVIAKAFSDAGWGGADYGTGSNVRAALDSGLPDCP